MRTFAQLTQIYRDENIDEPVDVQIQYGWVFSMLVTTSGSTRWYATSPIRPT